ncbi:anillin-like [Uloborus diversus]|uniref:anillin-like n=1 Tax=Uloborus diversus TaxID=327109 RepID=UPI002409B1DF|nr:anillin-like [Uloborus diversus]
MQKDASLSSGQEKENIEEPTLSPFVPYATSKSRGLAALKKPAHDTEDAKRQCLKSVNHNAGSLAAGNKAEDNPFGPFHSATKVRGLAALRKQTSNDNDQMEEEITNAESCKPQVNNIKTYVFSTNSKELCSPEKSTRSGLTTNTKQLEKNTNVPHSPSTEAETKSSTFTIKLSQTSKSVNKVESSSGESDGSCVPPLKRSNVRNDDVDIARQNRELKAWDQAIAATLETESCVATPIKLRKCTAQQPNIEEKQMQSQKFGHGEIKQSVKDEVVKMNASVNRDIDPAELPLSARKALFEKALLQGSPKPNENVAEASLSVAQRAALFENASKNKQLKPTVPAPHRVLHSPVKSLTSNAKPVSKGPFSSEIGSSIQALQNEGKASPVKQPTSKAVHSTPSPSKNVGSHTRLVQQKLIENANTWQHKDIVSKTSEERKQELSSLVNHWEKLSSSSSLEKSNSEEELPQENFDDEPSLESEVISEEDASECSSANYNNQANVCETKDRVSPSFSQHQIEEPNNEDKFSCSDSGDEAGNNSEPESTSTEGTSSNVSLPQNFSSSSYYSVPSSHYQTLSSMSDNSNKVVSRTDSYSSTSSVGSYETIASSQSEDNPAKEVNPDTPLLYTVSFYRKKKQETKTPPVRTIVRKEQVSPPPDEAGRGEIIQERIQSLQQEILRQQTVISQTSQALNLCSVTTEFSGSSEQVEGERLLLIATQKRQACLNEIQRLKTHGAQGESIPDGTGTLTITGIQLPLKREFIAAELEGKTNEMVHHFLCLIRFGAQVIVTQMVSTSDKLSDGALTFTNHIKLQNLPADFSVVFEVYGLQSKKEVLPHEKKYHIKREHSKIRLTPKGKRAEGKILLPAVSSPGGPNAVRSSSFGVIGYTRFTLQNCNKSCFTLDKVPFTSPLEGVLKVKLSLHAEHKTMQKGFLTMFEDISGFGAWHRRWCALDAQYLSYWKYPDDEQKKEPIGTIELKQCVTGQVKLVARDICARPQTFQLVTVRPQEKGDKNTLISRSVNTLTTTKHLLSADTKEERVVWCNKLNEALTNVRKWNPQALRPVDFKQD